MFKSKEDLIKEFQFIGGKNYDYDNRFNEHSYDNGVKSGIKEAFSSIAERVKFYEKYKDHPNWLHDQQLHVYVQYQKEVEIVIGECSPKVDLKYQDWLFHFCFDGVK